VKHKKLTVGLRRALAHVMIPSTRELEGTMVNQNECEGCQGTLLPGVRDAATNHSGQPIPAGYTVVERCNTCERYASDEDAARALGENVQLLSGNNQTAVICRPVEIRFRFGHSPHTLDIVTDGGLDRALEVMEQVKAWEGTPELTEFHQIGMLGRLGAWVDLGAYAQYRPSGAWIVLR
jgi:hypothetical protein